MSLRDAKWTPCGAPLFYFNASLMFAYTSVFSDCKVSDNGLTEQQYTSVYISTAHLLQLHNIYYVDIELERIPFFLSHDKVYLLNKLP